MTTATFAKAGYIRLARIYGGLTDLTGIADWLDRKREQSRIAHWARSLAAIHDIDGLVALDVPWWSYKAIDEVDAFLAARPGARVFEYGSGASTVWLARRAGSVTSVEHHAGWHGLVSGRLSGVDGLAPVELRLVEPDAEASVDPIYISEKSGEAGTSFEAYASAIGADGQTYDVIVIDGRARAACLRHAADHLAPGGMIVFDNTGRARYRRAIAASGLASRVLRGLTPSLPYPDETTLLTRND
ncbi:class I SAM-dependent methyltransferase [Pelagovum pacificum]|uniref:Class I SAM-dependent methyltransferase n=1 Tax=Pelagovum pacificum TaxID=2588711 RepID=A0A5C5G8U0_9RHOB|nr:class I SAM-dependent methyltransferase [Pelagovum pacificum]QQA42038.1 class I SAM-dependent methyltransferase [Pelagovum pacificum]TNY31128.1 class I SAM-dependent methyltransferase [Pelagovum pacificum]